MVKRDNTLFFLKPDATIRPYVGARIMKEILDSGFVPVAFQELDLERDFLINHHYAVHKGKFFFDWLIRYVSLHPAVALIIEGNDIIPELRRILGPTFPEKAALEAPNSMRARYGIFGGVNGCHASDSENAAASEIASWHSRGYLKPAGNATQLAQSYIEEHIDSPYIDSIRYRELSQMLASNPVTKPLVHEKFRELLTEETRKNGSRLIEAFADSLVMNSLLGR